jgi:acetyltransferase
MSTRNLVSMMQPSSIVLIADPEKALSVCCAVARNLVQAGFCGEIFAVEADSGLSKGVTICPSIEALPKPPDLAVLMTGPDSLPDLVARLGECGTRAAAIIAAWHGEGETEHGQKLRTALLEAAKPHLLRIVGPGSLGVLVPGACLNASLAHVQPIKGNLAFVTQSGAVLTSVLDWATSRNIGFSHLVSLGDMIDVDFGDMLDYLANDLCTQAILLHVETVTHVRKFMSAARLAARMKPVIVLKGGRYAGGDCPPSVLGGGAAGADAVYDAAFRRAGTLRVYDLQELFDAVETLAKTRTMPGDRLAILTNGRGMGVLAGDALVEEGGRLAELSQETEAGLMALLPAARTPGNPVDILEDATGSRYARALELLLEDQGVDAVLVLNCPNALASGIESAQAIIDVMKKDGLRSKAHRLLTSWLGDGPAAIARKLFTDNRSLTYDTPRQAVRGFMQVVRFRRNQEMLKQVPPSTPEIFSPDVRKGQMTVAAALAERRAWLSETEVNDVLGAYGISVQPGARHQSAHELLVGAFEDAQFGPVISFGHGGAAADVIQDQALALPPLNLHLAREVMTRTRVYRRLEGRCEAPAADLDSIALTLVKVSQLLCDIPEIVEIEIHPLYADERGVTAGAARIRVAAAATSAAQRLALRPYPKELEETVRLPDGHTILLRPIRAEDEPAYIRLFDSMPAEDIFMRFMSPLKALSHDLAARLTQIDYDREMALVLMDESSSGGPELCGGVRISADADNERAEFAILLRRDMTGLGLGPMMMQRILRYARSRGIREVFGEVLSENTPMLKLCKALGFRIKRMLDDPGVVVASLAL